MSVAVCGDVLGRKGRVSQRVQAVLNQPVVDPMVDVDDQGFVQPEVIAGTDGDDSPEYHGVAPKLVTRGRTVKIRTAKGGTESIEVIESGQVTDTIPLRLDVANNPAAQMNAQGHGFLIEDPRSRPWKTARRTHCKFCGGPLPSPDLSKYKCEFDGPIRTPNHEVDLGDRTFRCRCGGCVLRKMIANRRERRVGHPADYCADRCKTNARNERDRWRRAVRRAEKRGVEPPPEPEDRGLKFERRGGLRSSAEGLTARA